jgi:uncharacterized Fe-S cluster-containing radical SAM superfamily protein
MNHRSETGRSHRSSFTLTSALGSAALAIMLALSMLYPAQQLAPITKRLVPLKRVVNARARGETFTCAALAGRSDYNICINSDMTVSCNCQDFSGTGKIGDLRGQSLTDVFDGPVVRRFLAELAEGLFPTDVCPICSELQPLPREALAAGIPQGSPPSKGIMVENTAVCNLSCDLCRRDELLGHRRQRSWSLDDASKVALALNKAAVDTIFFFSLGEPFISNSVLEQVRHIRSANPDARIVTSTNGILLDTLEKLEAALLMDYVYVSLDGIDQQTVEKYQVGGDFERTYRNMSRLVELRNERHRKEGGVTLPIIEWKYVTFRHNDRPAHIRQAVDLALRAGVDVLGFCRGAAALPKRSLRFGRDPVFSEVGTPHGENIIVNFAGIPEHLLGP